MSYILWVLFIIALLQHQQVGAPSTSNKAAVRQPNAEFNVTCNVKNNTPIVACGIRVWVETEEGDDPPIPPMDFNNGNQSSQQTRRSYNNDVLFKGKYSGLGLESGECGVTLSEMREGRYFIICHTHVTDLDEWYYESTSLIVQQNGSLIAQQNGGLDDADPLPTHFVNQTVAQFKDSYLFEFTASKVIDECRFFLPEGQVFSLSSYFKNIWTSEYAAVFEHRKCSVSLLNVTIRSSGPIWVLYPRRNGMWKAFPPQILFVQDIPGNATMTLTETTATCSLPTGIPAARLRLTVNGRTVRKDKSSASNEWDWPWISYIGVPSMESIVPLKCLELNNKK